MKYELSSSDQQKLVQLDKYDHIVRFLKHKEDFRFNVGDVLIKQYKRYNDEWKIEPVSSVSTAPKKYLYAYESELGVGYIKQILANGQIDGVLTCMTTFNPEEIRFQLDPEYADHIILGEGEFDFQATYLRKKKFREAAYKANKKLLIPSDNCVENIDFLESLNLGDVFWMGHDIDHMATRSFEVVAIEKYPATGVTPVILTDRYERDRWIKQVTNFPQLAKRNYILISVKCLTSRYDGEVTSGTMKPIKMSWESLTRFITKSPPFPMSEGKI